MKEPLVAEFPDPPSEIFLVDVTMPENVLRFVCPAIAITRRGGTPAFKRAEMNE